MITIYWYCFETPDAEKFVGDSLNELSQSLRKEPIKLNISIKALQDESDLAENVIAILNKFAEQSYTFGNAADEILGALDIVSCRNEDTIPKLLIYCRPDSRIAKAALKEKPDAEWGTTCCPLSVVYKSDKSTIWHETVHLLLCLPDDKDECYDKNTHIRKTDCNCETCIMQYKTPEAVDENWPSPLCDNLCNKNITQLQKLTKK
jgi:hypothetical protein